MKFCVVLLVLLVAICQGFLLDSCSSDSDCNNGCCKSSGGFFGSKQCHHYIALHGACHLDGHEFRGHCGCGNGMVCKDHTEGSSIAIEPMPGYGYCEMGSPSNSNSTDPLIATEG